MKRYTLLFLLTFRLFASGNQEIPEIPENVSIENLEASSYKTYYNVSIPYSLVYNQSEEYTHSLVALKIYALVFNDRIIKPRRDFSPAFEYEVFEETKSVDMENLETTMSWDYWEDAGIFRYYSYDAETIYQYSVPAESGIITMYYQVLFPDGSLTEMQAVQWNQVVP